MLAELNYTSPRTGKTYTRAIPTTAYCLIRGFLIDHASTSDSDRRFLDLYNAQQKRRLDDFVDGYSDRYVS